MNRIIFSFFMLLVASPSQSGSLEIKDLARTLYYASALVAPGKAAVPLNMEAREIDAELDNGIRLEVLFLDDPRTKKAPDYLFLFVKEKKNEKWELKETFLDAGLEGLGNETKSSGMFLNDQYILNTKDVLPGKGKKEIAEINLRFKKYLQDVVDVYNRGFKDNFRGLKLNQKRKNKLKREIHLERDVVNLPSKKKGQVKK